MQEVLKVIQNRRSVRGLFDPERPVAKKDLVKILEAGRWAPTAHNMQNFEIIVVDDKKLLEAIGNIRYRINPVFIKENYAQLSFSEAELRRKKVGILGTMFPSSWLTPKARRTGNADEHAVSFLGKPIQTSPVLVIVAYDPAKRAPASAGDFLGIISLGCVMENMWLMAQSLGLSLHIVSALGAGPVEREVKKILRIPKSLKIAFSFRLGYSAYPLPKAMRVRRDIKDFTHHNRFVEKGLD